MPFITSTRYPKRSLFTIFLNIFEKGKEVEGHSTGFIVYLFIYIHLFHLFIKISVGLSAI